MFLPVGLCPRHKRFTRGMDVRPSVDVGGTGRSARELLDASEVVELHVNISRRLHGLGQKHVLRPQDPVHSFLPVKETQRGRELGDNQYDMCLRDRLLLGDVFEYAATLAEVHGSKEMVLCFVHVVNVDDMRVPPHPNGKRNLCLYDLLPCDHGVEHCGAYPVHCVFVWSRRCFPPPIVVYHTAHQIPTTYDINTVYVN